MIKKILYFDKNLIDQSPHLVISPIAGRSPRSMLLAAETLPPLPSLSWVVAGKACDIYKIQSDRSHELPEGELSSLIIQSINKEEKLTDNIRV